MKMRKTDPVMDAMFWERAVVVILIVVLMALAILVHAQAQTTLPEITVSPSQQPPRIQDELNRKNGEGKNGAGDKGGDNHALDKLNQDLKRKADETNPIGNNPPLDARSPDTKTGVVNIPGVQQQYGKNFGHSVVPYRPPPPVYTSPLGHR